MTRILLIRHGQSEWNEAGRWQGQADPPLTSLGRRQALLAAQRVGAVDAIAASTLSRALDTALIVSNHIGVGPVLVVDDLKERTAGEWEGLTRTQIHERYPGYLDDGRRPPGWEEQDELARRAMSALDDIDGQVGDGDVLAITHAGVLYAIAEHLGVNIVHGRIANLGGFAVDGSPGSWRSDGTLTDLLDGDDRTVPGQI